MAIEVDVEIREPRASFGSKAASVSCLRAGLALDPNLNESRRT